MTIDTSTPVLVLGGKENSLSLVRHLGRCGITVRASGPSNCWGMYSRYCQESFPIPRGQSASLFWKNLLLSHDEERLHYHIIFACSDEAIEFIAEHRTELEQRYLLDEAVPELQRALLDKKRTLELANAVGVCTPKFWMIKNDQDVEKIYGKAMFPLMVKPVHSHKFTRVFGRKLFIIEKDFDELVEKVRLAHEHNLEVMIVEMIPGPDDLLCSYYTYVDKNGNNLFHYTKRILRRFPVNRGNACYHITEWLPDTAELGRKFFDGIEFRGMGNIEFKRDTRDGKLKVIEVNARFTAAQELIVRSGAPIDLILYCHLTGQSLPEFKDYEQFLRYWYPFWDFMAFLDLWKHGELSFSGWVKSVLPYQHVLPNWNLWDPMPFFGAVAVNLQRLVRSKG
jgi:predicted ATP-grasp superfamily ATP-dependent carboligase